MQAVIAIRPGPPDVLELVERPDLDPAAGQVLVAVEAAAITFIDTQTRAGKGPRPLPPEAFPLVLGNGVVGPVAGLGGGVDAAWLGATVVTATGGQGGYASQAVAPVADLHRVPPGLDARDAVALLADGRTALGLVQAAAIAPGDTVVVTAAAGGVGGILVQLAHRAGAFVVGLAGDERKLGHARGLGADRAINYRDPDWAGALPAAVDVAFDGVGGATSAALTARLNRGARYLPHGAASGTMAGLDATDAAARGITVIPLSAIGADPAELYELVEQALALAAGGEIHAVIGQTFPLADAAAAHAAVEARGTVGKTLLIP